MDAAEGGVFFPLKGIENMRQEFFADADDRVLDDKLVNSEVVGDRTNA